MNAKEVIQRLKEGNERFMSDSLERKLQDQTRKTALVGGQNPYAIILSCADSRVVPELAFDSGLGEIFVVRVAGNVANSASIASIEYAVAHLGSPVIVVLGHQNCGAVTAAIQGGDNGYNLNFLLSHVTPAVVAAGEGAEVNDVVRVNAEMTVKELQTRSPIISEAVSNGNLTIVPAYYNLSSGKIDFLD